jgi:mannose/fructose/N-acetylgalactosamine-specific phosphotransferase system component IIC
MRWIFNIVGVLLVLIGLVWFFQGVNVLLGSFMSGKPLYAILGLVVGLIGGALLFFGNRRGK